MNCCAIERIDEDHLTTYEMRMTDLAFFGMVRYKAVHAWAVFSLERRPFFAARQDFFSLDRHDGHAKECSDDGSHRSGQRTVDGESCSQ